MSLLSVFLGLACLMAVTNSCIVPEKKEDQEVHVFHIGPPKDSPNHEPDIIELHVPEGRRKRETYKHEEYLLNACESHEDCPLGEECMSDTSKCQPSSQVVDSKIDLPRIIYGCLIPSM